MNETTRPTRFLDARATRLDTETMAYAGYAPGHRVIERTPLEEALLDYAGSAIIVSHDRFFLDRVCSHTLAFEDGGHVEVFEGSVSEYAEWRTRTGSSQSYSS